jgi:hypothetical protein
MSGIFISYRRDDSEGQAGRLFEGLKARFGEDRVFIDVDDIEPAATFAASSMSMSAPATCCWR